MEELCNKKIEEIERIISKESKEGRIYAYQFHTIAFEIYQLFLPYQDALWSDKEGECFWCKSPTHWLDICYEGYVCSAKCQQEIAQDVKSRSESKPESREDRTKLHEWGSPKGLPRGWRGRIFKGSLEPKPEKHLLISKGNECPEEWSKPDDRLLTDKEIRNLPELRGIDDNQMIQYTTIKEQIVAEAQDAKTASIKDAEWIKYLADRGAEWAIGKQNERKTAEEECSKKIEEISLGGTL